MPISDQVISEAVARYERERDRYLKLAARVADICLTAIVAENSIGAQVTSRTKTVKSFRNKLKRFSKIETKNYPTADAVFAGISDFSGVRIATYRPEDEIRAVEEIKKYFRGNNTKEPEIEIKDKLEPSKGRFYRATHCQVYLPTDELSDDDQNIRDTGCEIQVCSMMAHVWNEIEHDISYKPEGTGPDATEIGLLTSLGHLARSGDATITQLLAATKARLQLQNGDFLNPYAFVARMELIFPENDLSAHSGQLFEEIQALGLNSPDKITRAIGSTENLEAKAKSIIDEFNRYLIETDEPEFALIPESSDLILVMLLDEFSSKIEQNHPAGRGRGRPPRIRSIATRYKAFMKRKTEQ